MVRMNFSPIFDIMRLFSNHHIITFITFNENLTKLAPVWENIDLIKINTISCHVKFCKES